MAFTTLRASGNEIRTVSINDHGAELSSIIDGDGRQLLWQGESVWPRRAPILFPIIGQLPGGVLRHDGTDYQIGQHGFARDQTFVVSQESEACALYTLVDNDTTLAQFPFSFRLEVKYELADDTLTVTSTITNTDVRPFSASFGGHPAFAWPLVSGLARVGHTIEFSEKEPGTIRRISGGLVLPERFESPVEGRVLTLNDALFVDDAVIFDELASRSVTYSAPGAPAIVIRFDDFAQLGVWSKSPGQFVCIEPWFGMTAPQGFSGEYSDKPLQFELGPAGKRTFAYSVTVRAAHD